jgi:hypothetical protein
MKEDNKINEIKKLHADSMKLIEDCNVILSGEKILDTINIQLAGVVKNLNEKIITEYTGIKPEDVK